MNKVMKEVIEEVTGEEVSLLENGIEWTDFDELENKITFEDNKVVFVSDLENGSKSTLRVNRELFEKDVKSYTLRLYDISLMYNEGDRENYSEEGEDVIFDIDDKEFLFNN